MVLVDTDILLIDFRYHRDRRFGVNSAFLSSVQAQEPGITVYNLMEFLGQMSFGTSPAKLVKWDLWLRDEYGLRVIWPVAGGRDADRFFHEEIYDQPFSKMLGAGRGMAFNDALIIGLAERTPGINTIVTWNARHFVTETTLKVKTPEQYVNNL